MAPTLLLHCIPTFTFRVPTVVRYGGDFLSVELPSPVEDHKRSDGVLAQVNDPALADAALSLKEPLLNELVQRFAIGLILHFAKLVVSHFDRLLQTFLKFLPLLIASRLIVRVVISTHIRRWTDLSSHIPMPHNILDRDVVLLHELRRKPDRVLNDLLIKVPILIRWIRRFGIQLGRAHFDSDGIGVPAIGMGLPEAARRPTVPRSVLIAYAMIDDVFFVNGVVCGCTGLRIIEPFARTVCTAECTEEVNHKIPGVFPFL